VGPSPVDTIRQRRQRSGSVASAVTSDDGARFDAGDSAAGARLDGRDSALDAVPRGFTADADATPRPEMAAPSWAPSPPATAVPLTTVPSSNQREGTVRISSTMKAEWRREAQEQGARLCPRVVVCGCVWIARGVPFAPVWWLWW
jgi:hypothetical protein